MGLTPAQQNAANVALVELRQFYNRAYAGALAMSFVPGQDEASAGAELKNIGADGPRIDKLEAQLAEVMTGDRDYSDWCDAAKTIHDDLSYQSDLADTFNAWDVLKAATEQTAVDVKTGATEVVAPAAIGLLTVVALVAAAYLVFTVRR